LSGHWRSSGDLRLQRQDRDLQLKRSLQVNAVAPPLAL